MGLPGGVPGAEDEADRAEFEQGSGVRRRGVPCGAVHGAVGGGLPVDGPETEMTVDEAMGKFIIVGAEFAVVDAHAGHPAQRGVALLDGQRHGILHAIELAGLAVDDDRALGPPVDETRLVGVGSVPPPRVPGRGDPRMRARCGGELGDRGEHACPAGVAGGDQIFVGESIHGDGSFRQ